MAVKIGTTNGNHSTGSTNLTITQTADETADFNTEYGVGNYSVGMQIAIDDNNTVYTVTGTDSGGNFVITPALTDTVDSDTDVFKVYEGAHGTAAEQSRKRLLGYI